MKINSESQANSFLHTVAVVSLTIALLSFISPQVFILGRGMRTTLPALAVSFLAISFISPMSFFRAIARFWPVLLSGSLFLAQGAMRFSLEDNKPGMLWSTYFVGPLIALTFLLWVAALSDLGEAATARLRRWLTYCWCLSLAAGLPVLIAHPKVARLTMGNLFAERNAAIWAPYGVGEYHVYTAMAICLAPLFGIIQKHLRGLWRWIALLLLAMAAGAVIVSTFTMAAVLLMLSMAGALFVWTGAVRGLPRMLRAFIVILALCLFPLLYSQAKLLPQTEFITSKVERLFKGVTSSGLEKGDETNRGMMVMADLRTFSQNPFLGYIPHVQGKRGHGHSSFGDSLAFFGILGAFLWVFVLYRIFRISIRDTDDTAFRRVIWIGWAVLILGGAMNPTWHSPSALSALIALTLPARKKPLEDDATQGNGS